METQKCAENYFANTPVRHDRLRPSHFAAGLSSDLLRLAPAAAVTNRPRLLRTCQIFFKSTWNTCILTHCVRLMHVHCLLPAGEGRRRRGCAAAFSGSKDGPVGAAERGPLRAGPARCAVTVTAPPTAVAHLTHPSLPVPFQMFFFIFCGWLPSEVP